MAEDKLILEGMVFYGYHGANRAERELGQRFVVDLEVTLNLAAAGASDSLEDTVNYSHLYRVVQEIMEGQPRNLLEHVAEEICAAILSRFPAETVRVRLKKPGAPIKGGGLGYAGVELVRRRAA